ncbi:MAG: phosphonate ABC transporter ATP-binding protein [Planctomycetota bacterium]|jgi:phosphonate transport system ATP-binding protein
MIARAAGFRLESVSVRYGATAALDDVNLEIGAGEAVAFVGPSGAGKTTLLRLLNGTLRPTQGAVHFNGSHLGSLSRGALRRVRSAIGFVHQDLSLVPNLRVSQNVVAGRLGRLSFPASVRAMLFPAQMDLLRAHELLERVGIAEKLFERTDRLSGGQRQRVAVARALFQDPAALLADEPVSSVDPARARDTVDLLTRISREEHLTLCMSLHNLDLARDHFPRLVGLRHGRVVFDRATIDCDPGEFQELYALSAEEMLADGA